MGVSAVLRVKSRIGGRERKAGREVGRAMEGEKGQTWLEFGWQGKSLAHFGSCRESFSSGEPAQKRRRRERADTVAGFNGDGSRVGSMIQIYSCSQRQRYPLVI